MLHSRTLSSDELEKRARLTAANRSSRRSEDTLLSGVGQLTASTGTGPTMRTIRSPAWTPPAAALDGFTFDTRATSSARVVREIPNGPWSTRTTTRDGGSEGCSDKQQNQAPCFRTVGSTPTGRGGNAGASADGVVRPKLIVDEDKDALDTGSSRARWPVCSTAD